MPVGSTGEAGEHSMKRIILAAVAASILVPAGASAQSYGEARRSQREVQESRRDLREAQRFGDRGDVRDARRELREDRREAREDWRDYRRTHGDVYRRGAYRGPSGYRYRPVTVGHRFTPGYYGRNYWINDYRTYRLAAPRYGYQRWVRYGNDVVLVDTRSGTVAQVYNGFFY
jgi:Ni/Co efflux regulator RcnB